MKRYRLGLLLAVTLTVSSGAFAAIVPQQPNGSEGANVWLYQIYNQLYGTALTQSSDLVPLQLPTESISIDPDVESITFQAVWRQAYMESDFGVYTAGNTGTMTDVLGPFLNYDPNPVPIDMMGQGDLRDQNITNTISALGLTDLAFYQQVRLPNEPPNNGTPSGLSDIFTWYSESGLNPNSEVHVLLLTTPDPNVLLLAFEDLPYEYMSGDQDLGDQDYQDLLIQITLNRTVVPEPASIGLLGLGLAGLVARRYFKAA